MANQHKEHHKKKNHKKNHNGHHKGQHKDEAKRHPVVNDAPMQVATEDAPEPRNAPTAIGAVPRVTYVVSSPMRTVEAPVLSGWEEVSEPIATAEAPVPTTTVGQAAPTSITTDSTQVPEVALRQTLTEAVAVDMPTDASSVELPAIEPPVEPLTESLVAEVTVEDAPVRTATEVWKVVVSSGGLVLGQSQREYAVYDQKNDFGHWPLTEEGYRLATQTYEAHRQSSPNLPPESAAPRQPVYKRGWFWLIVVVLGIGGISALVFGAGVGLNRTAQANHTVVYSVSGHGRATSLFYATLQERNEAVVANVNLPWTKTITVSGPVGISGVGATLGSGGGSVTCTVTQDGHQITTNTASGASATAICGP